MNPRDRARSMKPLPLAHWIVLLLLAILLPATVQAQSSSPRRIAIVIGNANYTNEKPLTNPHADAALLARTFRQDLRFTEVIERRDLNRQQLFDLVEELRTKAYRADAVVVYFSGHGMRGPAGNYLIPVDAQIQSEAHLRRDALAAAELVDVLKASEARVALLVLDACRDNPYTARAKSTAKGLARMQVSGGNLLVAYATTDGQTADDGQPGNSPYARALAEQLRNPGRPVLAQLDAVRRSVIQATGNKQNPTREGDLETDVVLATGLLPQAPPNPVATMVPEPVVPAPRPGQGGGLSLEDLRKEQATREEWARWQQRMKADFDAAVAFSGAADLQVRAWERFLAAWAHDNPYSREDEELRQQAQDRLGRARQAAQAAAAPVPVNPVATQPSGATAIAGQVQRFTVNGVIFNMVGIPAGSFMTGSLDSEPRRATDEGPQRRVTLRAFQMGQTEVTQGLWRAVMGDNPSNFSGCGADCPVEKVSWNDAQRFIEKLIQQTGQRFRLPSEAQWEYAARAGTTTPFHTGQTITPEQANFNGNGFTYNGSAKGEYRQKTVRVGSFAPNAWGLSDMHGNVVEWVQDCYDEQAYWGKAPSDGGAYEVAGCSYRVLRGGAWNSRPLNARAADRVYDLPDSRIIGFGFRLARMLP